MASVRAATLLGRERLEGRSYPYPEALEPGAVLLRMLASGICGTDKHTFRGWAEYLYLKPGTAVFRVPDELPDDVAVLTEICAVTHSLERAARLPSPAGFRPGGSVAVVGVGALGLAHAVKASLMGAGRVLAIDPSRRRRELAARVAGAEPLAAGP